MNCIPPDVIASSVPFRFLVGPNEREFTIHSALFTHQSPVLGRLANGDFAEAAEKCVRWTSVDEDTFIRFWQYTYTGGYDAAPPVKLGSQSDANLDSSPPQSTRLFGATPLQTAGPFGAPPTHHAGLFGRTPPQQPQHTGMFGAQPPDVAQDTRAWYQNSPPARQRRQQTQRTGLFGGFSQAPSSGSGPTQGVETPEELKRKALWGAFKKQQFIDSSPSSTTLQTNIPVTRDTSAFNNPANDDYTNTFLSHVRLYVFAECYGITALMGHSLAQLHGLLEGFTLHEERIDDIVTLIRYCYENLAPESLRSLVTLYAACKVDKLWKNKQFQALVEAHSELSMALLGLMVNEV